MQINFTVYGEPQGKGRPRFSRHGKFVTTHTPDGTVLYENLIVTECRQQSGGMKFDDGLQLRIRVESFFTIPASVSKKKRAEMINGEIRPVKKPDADNILKVVCDALNGIAYRDDSQIAEALVVKRYDVQPRIEVTIRNI